MSVADTVHLGLKWKMPFNSYSMPGKELYMYLSKDKRSVIKI